MTSPLKRIQEYPKESKRLIGIEYDQFLALVELAKQRHIEKQIEREAQKIRINAKGAGRKAEMTVEEGVCLCLVYLRQKPIFEVLGLLFDISKTNANDAFHYWIKIIREILPASQMEEAEDNEQAYEKLQQKLTEHLLIVDSSEQRTAKPVDYEEQKKLYSGKKKMHTLKNQFIVLPGGQDIVDVTVGELGKTSDISLFRQSLPKFNNHQKFLGDKAYLGEPAIVTPQKKPKNGELTEEQKQENKKISTQRIGVEHLIGKIKIFRVAAERFRLVRHQYEQVILAVCGLVRVRLGSVDLLTLKNGVPLEPI